MNFRRAAGIGSLTAILLSGCAEFNSASYGPMPVHTSGGPAYSRDVGQRRVDIIAEEIRRLGYDVWQSNMTITIGQEVTRGTLPVMRYEGEDYVIKDKHGNVYEIWNLNKNLEKRFIDLRR